MMQQNKKGILWTLVAFIMFLVPPNMAYADSGTGGMEVEMNGYHIRLVFAAPVKPGKNEFYVQITGSNGLPIGGAEVEMKAQPIEKSEVHQDDMKAAPTPSSGMGGMGGVGNPTPTPASKNEPKDMGGHAPSAREVKNTPAAVQQNNPAGNPEVIMLKTNTDAGKYAGEITFSQSGHWMLITHISVEGKTMEASFPLEVVGDAPPYGVLAGFLGVNATLIGVAAVTRRKPTTV